MSHHTSAISNNEIAMTDLYQDVRTVIESWAKALDTRPPTGAEMEELNDAILNLDKRNENAMAHAKGDHRDQGVSTKSETRGVRSADATPNTEKPRTLLELIHYILKVFTEERLKELGFEISILMPDSMKQLLGLTEGTFHFNVSFNSTAEFSNTLGLWQNSIQAVQLVKSVYRSSEGCIQRAYNEIQVLLGTVDVLVTRINNLSSAPAADARVMKWDEDLVKPTNKDDLSRIAFCRDASKASALIISGESGSGKTWFCQRYTPKRLGEQDLALIYYSIEEGDGHKSIKSNDTLQPHLIACGNGMRYLRGRKRSDGLVYQCLSHLAMVYKRQFGIQLAQCATFRYPESRRTSEQLVAFN